jgi:hypothetical protein
VRILAEADDHLRSDPEALGRFGSAREIANGFAAELGTRAALAVAFAVWLQAALQGDPLDGVVIAAFEAAACLGGVAVLGKYLALRR